MNAPLNHGNLGRRNASADRRDRRPVSLRGFAMIEGSRTIDVTLVNLTYDGC